MNYFDFDKSFFYCLLEFFYLCISIEESKEPTLSQCLMWVAGIVVGCVLFHVAKNFLSSKKKENNDSEPKEFLDATTVYSFFEILSILFLFTLNISFFYCLFFFL